MISDLSSLKDKQHVIILADKDRRESSKTPKHTVPNPLLRKRMKEIFPHFPVPVIDEALIQTKNDQDKATMLLLDYRQELKSSGEISISADSTVDDSSYDPDQYSGDEDDSDEDYVIITSPSKENGKQEKTDDPQQSYQDFVLQTEQTMELVDGLQMAETLPWYQEALLNQQEWDLPFLTPLVPSKPASSPNNNNALESPTLDIDEMLAKRLQEEEDEVYGEISSSFLKECRPSIDRR